MLFNEIFIFDFNKEWITNPKELFQIKRTLIKPKLLLLDKLGITLKSTTSKSDNILEDVISSISSNSIVTVLLDLYHFPFRPNWFLNKHGRHVTTIFGYNKYE